MPLFASSLASAVWTPSAGLAGVVSTLPTAKRPLAVVDQKQISEGPADVDAGAPAPHRHPHSRRST